MTTTDDKITALDNYFAENGFTFDKNKIDHIDDIYDIFINKKLDQNDINLCKSIGLEYMFNMDYAKAKEYFKQAIDNFGCVESMTLLAKIHDMNNEPDEALRCYTDAVSKGHIEVIPEILDLCKRNNMLDIFKEAYGDIAKDESNSAMKVFDEYVKNY